MSEGESSVPLGLDELETEVTRTETRGTGRDLEKRDVEKMEERGRIRVTQDEDSRNNRRLGVVIGLGLEGDWGLLVPPLYSPRTQWALGIPGQGFGCREERSGLKCRKP